MVFIEHSFHGGTSPQHRLRVGRAHHGRVWTARSENEEYVLKDIPSDVFSNFNELIKPHLINSNSPYIRLPYDSIPNQHVKPDNIMVDYHQECQDVKIERVQGHLRGELNKPTDMYSFGAMCVYSILGRVIFDCGALPSIIRLQRQISYFPDRYSFNGFIHHVRDNEFDMQTLSDLWDDRAADCHSYRPFSGWKEVDDASLLDAVVGSMQLDPKRRFSAQQALEHEWFQGPDIE
ncbi:hypothetical protein BCR34DRAFT_629305 [Clohesyomyces aquaticus]|uniref:Protein kinase domain-containing protein n=1 Tax=Clohesyomyces aquaticus TaxID=1231657 RepID=A0A1Y1Y844_9PLEO|nr:hypothetical protein BCR34DRAFT_629305 [Clohesyomyces aquaticus]